MEVVGEGDGEGDGGRVSARVVPGTARSASAWGRHRGRGRNGDGERGITIPAKNTNAPACGERTESSTAVTERGTYVRDTCTPGAVSICVCSFSPASSVAGGSAFMLLLLPLASSRSMPGTRGGVSLDGIVLETGSAFFSSEGITQGGKKKKYTGGVGGKGGFEG